MAPLLDLLGAGAAQDVDDMARRPSGSPDCSTAASTDCASRVPSFIGAWSRQLSQLPQGPGSSPK